MQKKRTHAKEHTVRYGGSASAWDFFTKPIRDAFGGDWAYLIPPVVLLALFGSMSLKCAANDHPLWKNGMCGTADARELSFMFARIEKNNLTAHANEHTVRYGGSASAWDFFTKPIRDAFGGDWAYLIPPVPIKYGPLGTLWQRVAEMCRERSSSVEEWNVWDGGKYPLEVLPAEQGTFIYVFVVPLSDYLLTETRDHLTQLRINTISSRVADSPSKGAQPSRFAAKQKRRPLAIGRPKNSSFYPIPISLLNPDFARFKKDLISAPIEPDLSPLAYKWCRELSEFFPKERSREAAETTCGSSDAVLEAALYHLEALRAILPDDRLTGAWRRSRIPSIIIIHNGPNIQVLGAVCLAEPYIEVLSPSLPLYFNEYDAQAMESLIRFMGALRRLFRSLLTTYEKNSVVEPIRTSQIKFPYPSSYQPINSDPESSFETSTAAVETSAQGNARIETSTGFSDGSFVSLGASIDSITESVTKLSIEASSSQSNNDLGSQSRTESSTAIPFSYVDRIDPLRLVFGARTATTERLIVKFGYGHYGVDAHRAAAKAGLAPALLGFSKLEGGWWMVVMECLDSGFRSCAKYKFLEQACRTIIEESMAKFTALGYVHGNLRASNVLVRKLEGQWECRLIDFDWAGRENQVTYPLGVYCTSGLYRPLTHMDGLPITVDHDRQTIFNVLAERTE
ncbi:hypothetical protein D9757_015170 [Collybiopsis confluens]|uniref:Protein kinase domain-containing protein n=1 Tax=Collybiopsis confluens TaxID=2823264 RepID=A0A8H5CVE2_9AGAR|nr:hypothetical protein D9757_015170 [Collybiopsis confluens]